MRNEKESSRKPKNAPKNKAVQGPEDDKDQPFETTAEYAKQVQEEKAKNGGCGGCGKKRKTRVFVREKRD